MTNTTVTTNLEEAQAEGEASDPAGSDFEVLGEDLSARIPVLVSCDLLAQRGT